jgi:hypothetical protein
MSCVELRKVDVDVVTFGQYMRPTKRHMKVDRYVEPAEFSRWKQIAEDVGFLYVASGPLVRSSYKVGVSGLRHLPGSSNFSPRQANTLSRTYSAERVPRRDLIISWFSRRARIRSYLHDLQAYPEEGIRAYNTVVLPRPSKLKTTGRYVAQTGNVV